MLLDCEGAQVLEEHAKNTSRPFSWEYDVGVFHRGTLPNASEVAVTPARANRKKRKRECRALIPGR